MTYIAKIDPDSFPGNIEIILLGIVIGPGIRIENFFVVLETWRRTLFWFRRRRRNGSTVIFDKIGLRISDESLLPPSGS